MRLAILDAVAATADMGAELADLKEFRKSTRSILKGVALVKSLFERNPTLKALLDSKRVAFIVGTSVGEIEVTRDFLKELALTNTARPFLFQLSSHNSTAGFLSQYFGLKGAAITVSDEYQSAEAAVENADILLNSDHCDLALVFCVDQVIDGWMDLKMYAQNPQLKAASGASVMLLAKENIGELKAKGYLSDLDFGKSTAVAVAQDDFYDSNVLESIVHCVNDKKQGLHSIVRPDGTLSQFSLDFSTL